MNWHRIKTFAKVLVFGSFLSLVFPTLLFMIRSFGNFSEGGDIDQAQLSSDLGTQILLGFYLVPVIFFGIVLWVIAVGELRRRTVNPRLGRDDDRPQ